MKLESLVIANQNVAVNTFPGLVHTARHTMGKSFYGGNDEASVFAKRCTTIDLLICVAHILYTLLVLL